MQLTIKSAVPINVLEKNIMSKEITCEQKNICIWAGRFSTCYKEGMKSCDHYEMCNTLISPSEADLNKLIDDHWSYIKELLLVHGHSDADINTISFHYKTAFKHGYKHAKEKYNG